MGLITQQKVQSKKILKVQVSKKTSIYITEKL